MVLIEAGIPQIYQAIVRRMDRLQRKAVGPVLAFRGTLEGEDCVLIDELNAELPLMQSATIRISCNSNADPGVVTIIHHSGETFLDAMRTWVREERELEHSVSVNLEPASGDGVSSVLSISYGTDIDADMSCAVMALVRGLVRSIPGKECQCESYEAGSRDNTPPARKGN